MTRQPTWTAAPSVPRRFDADGRFLGVWDLVQIYGNRSEPEDIVIDAARRHVYIAEVYEHRVLHLLLP